MEKIKEKSGLLFISEKKIKIDINKLDDILSEGCNHGLTGSRNLGNTCYINSSIACLSNCTELTVFFLSKEYEKYINSSNKNGLKGELANAWYKLLKEYWKTDKKSGNPYEIKSLIGKKYKKFDSYEQQDANEFIILFLELLSEDLNEINNKKYLELNEQQLNETDEQCAKRFWELHLSRNNSVITDLFCGINKSIIICPLCKYSSKTYIPFTSISLIIPDTDQLRKVKYYNFVKENIYIYCIPKFSLGKSYKIYVRVKKNSSFNEILIQIKQKIKKFPYELKFVDFISVKNKRLYKIMEGDDIYNNISKDDKGFYFIIEKDIYNNKEMVFIPIYIKIGDIFSSYPRGIYVYSGMSYKTMKKKIYILIRKYLYYMISDNKKYNIDREIKKINSDYDVKNEKVLLGLIEQEYNDIIKAKEISKLVFPYNLTIQQDIDSQKNVMFFDGNKDYFENLQKYQINSDDAPIDLLAVDLNSLNNILIININNKSKLYRASIGDNIDKCKSIQSEDYGRKDYLKDNNITLDDCLQLYNIKEYLEGGNELHCKNCKNNVKASKKLEFFYMPKILCLCLSRFKKRGKDYIKNTKHVDFPLTNLNMNQYMTFKNGKNNIYDIFAVCEHNGEREEGHYTAKCKNYDGYWYFYDDQNCLLSSEKDVCTNNAYILFYRKRN